MISHIEPGLACAKGWGDGLCKNAHWKTHFPEVNACAKGCARPTREACETRETACAGVVQGLCRYLFDRFFFHKKTVSG